LDRRVLPAPQVRLVLLDLRVPKDPQELLVHRGQQELLAPRGQLVSRVQLVNKVLRVLLV